MGLSTPQNIKWMREAELKHGRMAQLAWAGWVAVDLGMKFPGARYADLSSYKAAMIVPGKSLLDQSVGYEMLLLFLWVGTFETIGFTQIYNMMEGDDDREPGDFGFDPLGLLPGNEEQYKTAELTHGRAAMLAFSAVATQSCAGAIRHVWGRHGPGKRTVMHPPWDGDLATALGGSQAALGGFGRVDSRLLCVCGEIPLHYQFVVGL